MRWSPFSRGRPSHTNLISEPLAIVFLVVEFSLIPGLKFIFSLIAAAFFIEGWVKLIRI
jgi:hypothetical protein